MYLRFILNLWNLITIITDEKLASMILEREASNASNYMELGLYPIRFELMKRKPIFLQYIVNNIFCGISSPLGHMGKPYP